MLAGHMSRERRSSSFFAWLAALTAIPGVLAVILAMLSVPAAYELSGLAQANSQPQMQAALTAFAGRQVWLTAGICACVVAMVACGLMFAHLRMIRPLREIDALFAELGAGRGDLSRELQVVRDDDIGLAVRSLNNFL